MPAIQDTHMNLQLHDCMYKTVSLGEKRLLPGTVRRHQSSLKEAEWRR